MNQSPGAGSISRHVGRQSSTLPLNHGCPLGQEQKGIHKSKRRVGTIVRHQDVYPSKILFSVCVCLVYIGVYYIQGVSYVNNRLLIHNSKVKVTSTALELDILLSTKQDKYSFLLLLSLLQWYNSYHKLFFQYPSRYQIVQLHFLD